MKFKDLPLPVDGEKVQPFMIQGDVFGDRYVKVSENLANRYETPWSPDKVENGPYKTKVDPETEIHTL